MCYHPLLDSLLKDTDIKLIRAIDAIEPLPMPARVALPSAVAMAAQLTVRERVLLTRALGHGPQRDLNLFSVAVAAS